MTQARDVTATFGTQTQSPITPPPPDDGPRPTGPTPDEPPITADDTPPVAAIASNRLRMNDRGFVKVRIDCGDSPEDCLGDVEVRLRLPGDDARTRVGHAEFDIAAGESHRVKLRLRRRARRFVRRRGRGAGEGRRRTFTTPRATRTSSASCSRCARRSGCIRAAQGVELRADSQSPSREER